jgi:plasmid stabilization system protein ParE
LVAAVPRALIYAPEVLADLDAAGRWLTQPGSRPRAWRRLAARRAEIRRLLQQPCLWPVGEFPGVRELPCSGGYRALYRAISDTGSSATADDVRVLRVFGPGQDRSTI